MIMLVFRGIWPLIAAVLQAGAQFARVSRVCSMYVLQEADVSKFVEAADQVIRRGIEARGTSAVFSGHSKTGK